MLDYMRNGGFNMWVLVIVAIATVALAATRARAARPGVLFAGCVAVLVSGMFGLSTGMATVSANYARFPDKVEALGTGLGELSNNGSFASLLATALGVAALVMRRNTSKEA